MMLVLGQLYQLSDRYFWVMGCLVSWIGVVISYTKGENMNEIGALLECSNFEIENCPHTHEVHVGVWES